jgi:hypothetical protein
MSAASPVTPTSDRSRAAPHIQTADVKSGSNTLRSSAIGCGQKRLSGREQELEVARLAAVGMEIRIRLPDFRLAGIRSLVPSEPYGPLAARAAMEDRRGCPPEGTRNS